MDEFDPYAEPKFDFEKPKSPSAPKFQNNTRKEKVQQRAEFQDVDLRETLSYNGWLLFSLRNNG